MTRGLKNLSSLDLAVIACRLCPRLVQWREEVARTKRAAFLKQNYWGKPLPGFGDRKARLLIVGLAPAAHGGNRTGRMFTGDRSGDWLYGALYECGFANQAESTGRDDGLKLKDVYITAVVRCAPPQNRPDPAERDRCLPYLVRELELLKKVRVILALGAFAWDGALKALAQLGQVSRPKPTFAHGKNIRMGPYHLIGSYHPSQQNTFTGKLTREMFHRVFVAAKKCFL